MESKIAEALEAKSVSVKDMYGDGRHVSIDVVSSAFEGKNSVARQRLVYKVSGRGGERRQAGRHVTGLAWVCMHHGGVVGARVPVVMLVFGCLS